MYPNVTNLDFYLMLPYDSFFFLKPHLTPIGFIPACNTCAFDCINQYLRFKILFISATDEFSHNVFYITFNA